MSVQKQCCMLLHSCVVCCGHWLFSFNLPLFSCIWSQDRNSTINRKVWMNLWISRSVTFQMVCDDKVALGVIFMFHCLRLHGCVWEHWFLQSSYWQCLLFMWSYHRHLTTYLHLHPFLLYYFAFCRIGIQWCYVLFKNPFQGLVMMLGPFMCPHQVCVAIPCINQFVFLSDVPAQGMSSQ